VFVQDEKIIVKEYVEIQSSCILYNVALIEALFIMFEKYKRTVVSTLKIFDLHAFYY